MHVGPDYENDPIKNRLYGRYRYHGGVGKSNGDSDVRILRAIWKDNFGDDEPKRRINKGV